MSVSEMNVGQIRRSHVFMRAISIVVLITFASMTISPGAQAIAQTVENATTSPPEETTSNPHADKLERIMTKLKTVDDKRSKGQSVAEEKAALRELRTELKALDAQILTEFSTVEQHIKDKHLPDVVLQRHVAAVEKFKAESAKTDADLADIDSTTDEAVVAAKSKTLRDRLEAIQTKRRHQPFDPNNLPFKASDPKPKAPRTKPEEFSALFPIEPVDGVRLAATNPALLLPFLQAAVAVPGPEYLAPTEDVQITQPIRDLAAQLNNNPVEIYNWVHNNIEYLPTYGSIQGSDLTLQTKQGNAFDTSSLLIALLRAAGIPARYVYGTVEIPIEKVMNWVGGVTVPNAAIELLAQGGVPVAGLAQGGVIKSARIEHVWVEAWVDFVPSRGAKNITPDTWVPMDGSFKQYTYGSGLEITDNVPFDPKALLNDLQTSATVDANEGWISGMDQSLLRTRIGQFRTAAETYVSSRLPDASIDDILGAKSIVVTSAPVLGASLRSRVTAIGQRFTSLPAAVRAQLEIRFYRTKTDQSFDSQEFSWSRSLPALATSRLTLSYDPATQADTDALTSYLNATGQVPAYLVRVRPTLRVDGSIVATGGSVTLGADQAWDILIQAPNAPVLQARNDVVAGTYVAVVSKYSTIVASQFAKIRERVVDVQSRLAQPETAPLVNKDETTGAYLHTAGLGYWALEDLNTRLLARTSNISKVNRFATGLFSWDPKVQYSYGIARGVVAGGMSTDIDIMLPSVVSKIGKAEPVLGYRIASGMIASHLEGAHWQFMRGNLSDPNRGYSTSQLLQALSLQGARIYTLTAANIAAALPALGVAADVKRDIQNAVASGLVAVVTDRSANINGWIGVGYVLIDPQTGAGAYRIDGGMNGGGESCQCFNFDSGLEIISGFLLTAAGEFEHLKFRANVASVIVSALSLLSDLCQIDSLKCLSEEDKEQARGLITGFFVIGLVVAFIVTALGGGVIGILISIILNYLSVFASDAIVEVAELNNSRQGCS